MSLHQRACSGRTRHHSCPARSLQRGDAAGVIVVLMRIDDQSHVSQSKAERSYVGINQRRRLRQPAINQNVPAL